MKTQHTAEKADRQTISIELPDNFDAALIPSLQLGLQRVVQLYGISKIAQSLNEDAERMAALLSEQTLPTPELVAERRLRQETLRKLLTEDRWYSAKEINEQQNPPPTNKSHPASDWKRRGRIFGVKTDGKNEYFPAYQFDDFCQPLPVVKDILAGFGTKASPWEIAAWFHFPNAWIYKDGKPVAPKDCLDDPDAVLYALAQRQGSYVA